MKRQRSQQYYKKSAHELPALREPNRRVKPNPGDSTSKWDCDQFISKQGELLYLVDVYGRGYQRNKKFSCAASQLPNITFENTTDFLIQKAANWRGRVLP